MNVLCMEEKTHGFATNEVVDLYRYLCVYETELDHIGNQGNLEKAYPELKKIKEFMSNFVCKTCTIDSLKVKGYVPEDNHVSMTKCKSSKTLSFLHHLRNAIAHGQIKQENGFVHLIDYGKKNNTKVLSARGKIKSSTLFKITNIINENIVLS